MKETVEIQAAGFCPRQRLAIYLQFEFRSSPAIKYLGSRFLYLFDMYAPGQSEECQIGAYLVFADASSQVSRRSSRDRIVALLFYSFIPANRITYIKSESLSSSGSVRLKGPPDRFFVNLSVHVIYRITRSAETVHGVAVMKHLFSLMGCLNVRKVKVWVQKDDPTPTIVVVKKVRTMKEDMYAVFSEVRA
ncbi:hypothetical protein EVAR_7489_1 [Eumeta japonica]|uniref:Uncharacterized protein n=1 Tax=Eumeta variegata TaxID=151549 RepID=A0A4C1Y5V6_EUMVA|nr:hypothetical protein EVAR_7489_1 [Eumeta japonica]